MPEFPSEDFLSCSLGGGGYFSVHWNYQNKYFGAVVGKRLPKQSPELFPVNQQGDGNLALS